MTVGQLIELLKEHPENLQVIVRGEIDYELIDIVRENQKLIVEGL